MSTRCPRFRSWSGWASTSDEDRELTCELSSPAKRTELKLRQFRPQPGYENRFGLDLEISGGKPIRALLDTGASGVLISERLSKEAGARRHSATRVAGVGQDGWQDAYWAVVDEIKVGKVRYQNCLVRVLGDDLMSEGEARAIVGIDGLWNDWLVTLDVPQLRLVL